MEIEDAIEITYALGNLTVTIHSHRLNYETNTQVNVDEHFFFEQNFAQPHIFWLLYPSPSKFQRVLLNQQIDT